MPCMCGDSECPSCGLAQGTLRAPASDADTMTDNPQPLRKAVVVHIEGGCCTSVHMADGSPVDFFVVDHDDIKVEGDGGQAIESRFAVRDVKPCEDEHCLSIRMEAKATPPPLRLFRVPPEKQRPGQHLRPLHNEDLWVLAGKDGTIAAWGAEPLDEPVEFYGEKIKRKGAPFPTKFEVVE